MILDWWNWTHTHTPTLSLSFSLTHTLERSDFWTGIPTNWCDYPIPFLCSILPWLFLFFSPFHIFLCKKHEKSIIWQAFGVCSTLTLVKMYYRSASIYLNSSAFTLSKTISVWSDFQKKKKKKKFQFVNKAYFYAKYKFGYFSKMWQVWLKDKKTH